MLLTRFLFCPFFASQSIVLVVNLCSRECKSTFFSSTAAWKVEQLVARHFCRMFQSNLTLSGCTTSTQLPLKLNELLTHCWPFISRYTGQVLKLELCRVMSRNTPLDARAGKYFAVNFRRGKECELNIPFQKYIGIIDLSAELPECWINLPPQTNSIQFNFWLFSYE